MTVAVQGRLIHTVVPLPCSELMLMSDKIGTLEAGKLADLILVQGDPLQDIRIMCDADNVKLVMQDGRIVKDIRGQR